MIPQTSKDGSPTQDGQLFFTTGTVSVGVVQTRFDIFESQPLTISNDDHCRDV